MEQIDIITLAFFALAALVLLMGIVFAVLFYKPIGEGEVLNDNAPARYEDYEAIFYDPLN